MMRRGLILAALVGATALAGFVVAERFGGEAIEIPEDRVPPGTHSVSAIVETEPVPSEGDAADDPAIWVDRDRPDRSTVIGTDKRAGIAVYDLAGRELQYRPDGATNNVDLREGFPLASQSVAIVAATNRSSQTVALYRVDPRTRELVEVDREAAEPDLVVSGICLYRSPEDGSFGFFVTGKDGEVEQWSLAPRAGGTVTAERIREFEFGSETEACVVDDEAGAVYFAEEEEGIWGMPLDSGSDDERELVDSTGEEGHLIADVEGLAIARFPEASTQLVASSQGSNSFVVYRRGGDGEYEYLYDFEVVDGMDVDGAENTDGIDLTTESLGPELPHGLLVVQDGENDDGNQNFKLVPLCLRAVVCPS